MSENLGFIVSELVVGSGEQDIYQQMIMREIEILRSVKYTKGQLISKGLFDVIVSTKKTTKFL